MRSIVSAILVLTVCSWGAWAADAHDIQAAFAKERAAWNAKVTGLRGIHFVEVTEADPAFGIDEGAIITLVVHPHAPDAATLGEVGLGIGEQKYVCRIVTAQEDGLGFEGYEAALVLNGKIATDAAGKPATLRLTLATHIDGAATLKGKIKILE